jgi:hypothetical protein
MKSFGNAPILNVETHFVVVTLRLFQLDYLHDHPGPRGDYVLYHAPLFSHDTFTIVDTIRIYRCIVLLNDVIESDEDPVYIVSFGEIGLGQVMLCVEPSQIIKNGQRLLIGSKKFSDCCH